MIAPTLSRYLVRQSLRACAMTLTVLVAITLALFLGELLGDVAEGRAPAAGLVQLLLLRIPEALVLTAPLALAVGVLMSLGELAQNNELSIVRAAGVSPGRMFRIVMFIGLCWAAGVAAVAGWIAPWAEQRTAALAERVADDLMMARIQPGQFQSLAGGRLTVYVGEADRDAAEFEHVFLHVSDGQRSEAVVARSARVVVRPDSGRRVLSLYDGMHIGHARGPAGLPLRRIEFERNDIELPVASRSVARDPIRTGMPSELVRDGSSAAMQELQRRLLPTIISAVLVLFALPITLSQARGSRFGVVLVVIAIYLVYGNVGNLILARQGEGILVLHAVALGLAVAPVALWWRRW